MNILSRFGYLDKPLSLAENMTLKEYHLKIEAYLLKREDEERFLHAQAFYNLAVKSVKGKGDSAKPMFTSLNEFYDSEKMRNSIRSEFESDYKPLKSPVVKKKTASDLRIKRMIQYEQMLMQNGKG